MKRVRKPSEKLLVEQSSRPLSSEGGGGIGGGRVQSSAPSRKRPRPSANDKERQEAAAAAAALKRAVEEHVKKTVNAPSVTLHPQDKAAQLVLSDDRMTCKGVEGGFRMARATHGVHRGEYYWECQILPSDDPNAHVRVGWSTEKGELQAPVGYDKFSFAYRDLGGSKVHNSQRIDNYGEAYGPGDIVGCYLYIATVELGSTTNKNEMRFFKNGKDQGVAYSGDQIPSGAGWVYYPAVSLYMEAEVSVNFGPTYIVKPATALFMNAVSELSPMSPEDRQKHEQRIAQIKTTLTASTSHSNLDRIGQIMS